MGSNCRIDPAMFGFSSMIHRALTSTRQTQAVPAHACLGQHSTIPRAPGLPSPSLAAGHQAPLSRSDFTSSCLSQFLAACPSHRVTTSPQLGGTLEGGNAPSGGQRGWSPQPPAPSGVHLRHGQRKTSKILLSLSFPCNRL